MLSITKVTPDADRIVPHRLFADHQTILVPIADDIYKRRFDFEQLAVEPAQIGRTKGFRIVCIPFLLYGLNKGDVVAVNRLGIYKKKLLDDGQYGYRIGFHDFTDDHQARHHIEETLQSLMGQGFEAEPFNHKIAAVNAINAEDAIRLEEMLNAMVAEQNIVAFDTIG